MSSITHDHLYDLPEQYDDVPQRTLRDLRQYVERGKPIGDFLSGVLADSLSSALTNADSENKSALFEVWALVQNRCPDACHGSAATVDMWINANGLQAETVGEEAV